MVLDVVVDDDGGGGGGGGRGVRLEISVLNHYCPPNMAMLFALERGFPSNHFLLFRFQAFSNTKPWQSSPTLKL